MKYKKYLMGFLFVFSILFTTIVGTSNVLADTTSYSGAYNYDNTGNKQYRFITIVKSTQWTGNHYVSGQPTKGTYLKNGDMLYYSESGGPNYSLSVGVGYKIGSVSLGIPLGKISNGRFLPSSSDSSASYGDAWSIDRRRIIPAHWYGTLGRHPLHPTAHIHSPRMFMANDSGIAWNATRRAWQR